MGLPQVIAAGVDAWWSFVAWLSDFLSRILLAILAAGPMPKHIAFVMDGNRRYARSHQKRVQEGHSDGYTALHSILDVCLQLNIQCVTVYAFSIENFKRPKEEVDALMALAKDKLVEMSQKRNILDRHGVRLNVIGRRELLPLDVQEVAARVENMTKDNKNAILNICMPYTSRDEMASAVEEVGRCCKEDLLCAEDIMESDIDKHIETTARGSRPVDILVRTSGTYRLSDFMLWQVNENVQIHFSPTYWPDFGLRDFVPLLLAFQRKAWTP